MSTHTLTHAHTVIHFLFTSPLLIDVYAESCLSLKFRSAVCVRCRLNGNQQSWAASPLSSFLLNLNYLPVRGGWV
uniref:Secreted protein n=1 Tax=Scophthalmus maximus TaxID=52904 RepID=A0A8D3A510_SCOMX